MAQPARRVEPPEAEDTELPVDPDAIERNYRVARARRRARVRHKSEVRKAHARFYVVMVVLLGGALALVLGIWTEIQRLFGL